jgi:NADP-dependent 3-hydroxy acid dehydrogenase YdfG
MSQDQDKEMEPQKVAVVTGSSSGIGKKTALTLAKNNFLTYATMRDPKKGRVLKSQADKEKLPLKIVELDVTKDASVNNPIQSITNETSRIDVLVVMILITSLRSASRDSRRLVASPC